MDRALSRQMDGVRVLHMDGVQSEVSIFPSVVRKRKIYVRDLPFDVDEAELRDFVSRAGTVISVEIRRDEQGRSRGSAVVLYGDDTSAERALELNGMLLLGRVLTVDRYEPSKSASSMMRDARKVYFENIPEGMAWQNLKDRCRHYGRVVKVDIVRREGALGWGWAIRRNPDDVQLMIDDAANNGMFGEERSGIIEIKPWSEAPDIATEHEFVSRRYADPRPGSYSASTVPPMPSRKIILKNAPRGVKTHDIYELCNAVSEDCGLVHAEVIHVRSHPIAFAQFATVEQAIAAIDELHGHIYGGWRIHALFPFNCHVFTNVPEGVVLDSPYDPKVDPNAVPPYPKRRRTLQQSSLAVDTASSLRAMIMSGSSETDPPEIEAVLPSQPELPKSTLSSSSDADPFQIEAVLASQTEVSKPSLLDNMVPPILWQRCILQQSSLVDDTASKLREMIPSSSENDSPKIKAVLQSKPEFTLLNFTDKDPLEMEAVLTSEPESTLSDLTDKDPIEMEAVLPSKLEWPRSPRFRDESFCRDDAPVDRSPSRVLFDPFAKDEPERKAATQVHPLNSRLPQSMGNVARALRLAAESLAAQSRPSGSNEWRARLDEDERPAQIEVAAPLPPKTVKPHGTEVDVAQDVVHLAAEAGILQHEGQITRGQRAQVTAPKWPRFELV